MTIDLKFYFVLMSFILLENPVYNRNSIHIISGGKHQLKESSFAEGGTIADMED
ncbi:MAG TPA: hypothetical protein VHM26_01365 [Chitinophagaceae bacterium]|jgi:hypothetical protein|nr:hypothetical protein [Chitinophagaceae bacterium]